MVALNSIVELREGGDVQPALVLETSQGRLRLLTPEGREVRVPGERVVHETDHVLPGSAPRAHLVEELAAWDRRARARAKDVDLAELHGFLVEQASSPGGVDPSVLTLGDLAGLALSDTGPEARAAIHRALAAPNPFFQFTGRTWRMRTVEEARKEVERLDASRRVERERREMLEAARARLAGGTAELPASSAKFLRAVEALAVHGDAGPGQREAAEILAALAPDPAPFAATPERAFDLLVRLGRFSLHENLALKRSGVHVEFPEDVQADAARAASRPVTAERRLDLRGLDVVTIDDEKTSEIDDALSFERTAGGTRLGIHVADPAHFVDPGSPVDREAAERATSYYLPERTIPMLPAALAEDAASLVEGRDRPALSILVSLSAAGEVRDVEIRETLLRVTRRMTFEDCERALEGGEAPVPWLPQVAALGRDLEAERRANGATPIRAPEVVITFPEEGRPEIHLVDPGRPARQLVAEMMILANRHVAEWMRQRGLPAIYRRQGRPDSHVEPPPLDRYDAVAVNRFRRALQRTEVSLEPGFHSGLGVPAYLQATSPIRRYQDLVVHRIVKASLRGEPVPYTREEVAGLAAATEQAGRLARKVEHETDAYWILRALEARIGQSTPAVIVRVDDRRTFVELTELGHVTPIAPRPDHQPGRTLRLKIRSVRPRRGEVTLEELAG